MSNNLIFIFSIGFVVYFGIGCRKLGKEILFAWVALQGVLANLFVLKQIELMGLNATAADVFAISGILGLNLLQEYDGPEIAKKAVWASFACMVFFCIASQVHLLYIPSVYDTTHDAYDSLFKVAPRLVGASLITFFIAQQVDVRLYGFLRRRFPLRPIALTSTISMMCSQLLDTILFSILALYGIVHSISEVMLFSYLVKLMIIAATVPFIHLGLNNRRPKL